MRKNKNRKKKTFSFHFGYFSVVLPHFRHLSRTKCKLTPSSFIFFSHHSLVVLFGCKPYVDEKAKKDIFCVWKILFFPSAAYKVRMPSNLSSIKSQGKRNDAYSILFWHSSGLSFSSDKVDNATRTSNKKTKKKKKVENSKNANRAHFSLALVHC